MHKITPILFVVQCFITFSFSSLPNHEVISNALCSVQLMYSFFLMSSIVIVAIHFFLEHHSLITRAENALSFFKHTKPEY